MNDIRRSRRLRLPRRRHQSTKPLTSDDDEESDLEHERFQQKTIARSNQNANRTATAISIDEKLHQISSDQSSLFLYSINSRQKPTTNSDDLTPLSITASNTTPLTALTYSNTKQTELGTVKIDLTELSVTDTLASSSNQSLSFERKLSIPNTNNQIKTMPKSIEIDDTDTSMKSVVFSKENLSTEELAYQKQHVSCFTIPSVGNGDCMRITTPSVTKNASLPTIDTNRNIYRRLAFRWNLPPVTDKIKYLIGCSSLGLIAGIVLLMIIL